MRTGMDFDNGKYKSLTVKDLKKLLKHAADDTPIYWIDGACSGHELRLSNSQIEFHKDKIVIST